MPDISGITLLEKITLIDPNLPILMITGHGDVPMAVEAVKRERGISCKNRSIRNNFYHLSKKHWQSVKLIWNKKNGDTLSLIDT